MQTKSKDKGHTMKIKIFSALLDLYVRKGVKCCGF